MTKRTLKLSPKLEAELRDKLEDLLDEHDDVASKRKRITKALRGHLSILDDSISLVRRQLKGQDLDQLEIAGTEVPEPSRDPAVLEILKLAGGIVEPKKGDDEEGDEPPPMGWISPRAGFKASGVGTNGAIGRYELEQTGSGGWTATWKPTEGKPKLLVIDKPEAEAKDACQKHRLELAADELLPDELKRGDLKGAPEAFKKGRR